MTFFAILIENETTDDVIRINKPSDTHYKIEYVTDRPAHERVGGRTYTRTETDVASVIRYVNDVVDLILIDNMPPKFIHLHAEGYPNTVISRDNLWSARDIIIRTFMSIFCA